MSRLKSIFKKGLNKAMNYYFSGFTYDTQQQKLWFNNEIVKLTKKNNKLLFYLLQNNHKLVNKDELIKNVWDDRVVTGNTIDQTIMKLRKALNETSPGKYIEAVYGQGLRFIPDVSNDSVSVKSKINWKTILTIVFILAIVLITVSVYLNKPEGRKLSKIDIDLSHNKTTGINQNNWLIYGSGRYLTYLLSRYNGLNVDGFSFDNLPEAQYNVLALKITTHDDQKLNLLVDFKDSSEDFFIVKIIDNNKIATNKSTEFRSEKILSLFELASQWIVTNYTDNSIIDDQIQAVFTSDEYALESYFRGVEAQKIGNSSLATTFLETATRQDPEFKYAWYELAIAYRKQGDPKKALSILNAIKTNHPLLQYHITLVKAQCLDIIQDFEQAEIVYQQAYQAALNLKHSEKQSAVLVSQAIMNRKLKNYKKSESFLNTALELTNAETQPYLYGTIINTYAKLERDQQHYESAIEKSLLAIDAFTKAGDLRYAALSKSALSSILILRNELDSAKSLTSEALFYAQEVNNPRGISDNKTKLAMIYQKTGRFELAIENWKTVLKLTDKLELYANKAQAHLWLVKLYLHSNNASIALIHIKQIEQIYAEEPRQVINGLLIEAQVLTALNQKQYMRAKKLLAQMEKDNHWLSVLYRGDLALLQSKYAAAELHYLEYYDQYKNTGNFDSQVSVLNRLSQLYIQTKSDKLISNINKTASYNPPIYPYFIYKAQTAILMGNKIEANSLIEEVKIKSNDLWQQKDEMLLELFNTQITK